MLTDRGLQKDPTGGDSACPVSLLAERPQLGIYQPSWHANPQTEAQTKVAARQIAQFTAPFSLEERRAENPSLPTPVEGVRISGRGCEG